MLFGASRRITIQGMKKPAELGFMRVCQCLWGLGWVGLEPTTNALKGMLSLGEGCQSANKVPDFRRLCQ